MRKEFLSWRGRPGLAAARPSRRERPERREVTSEGPTSAARPSAEYPTLEMEALVYLSMAGATSSHDRGEEPCNRLSRPPPPRPPPIPRPSSLRRRRPIRSPHCSAAQQSRHRRGYATGWRGCSPATRPTSALRRHRQRGERKREPAGLWS